jgi:hypothetical protein
MPGNFSDLPIIDPKPNGKPFSSLPIVSIDAPRKTQAEKYGGLFYLGIAGLVVVVGLVGWFAYGAWSLRDVWAGIYTLHDGQRPEAERVAAAYALSRDPKLTQRQAWDIGLRRTVPPLARYVVAESLTAEAASADPRAYAIAVARSEGWPPWLRLLLARPLAYRAAEGGAIPPEPLAELRRNDDPAVGLWAAFAQAASDSGKEAAPAREALEQVAAEDGPFRDLAGMLLEALEAEPSERAKILDRATLWLRDHHPDAAPLWEGWEVRGDRLVPKAGP